MKMKLLVSLGILTCCALSANAFGNKNNGEDQKPDFKDVFGELFGLKKTLLGASKNHVNKKLDGISGGFNGIGGLLGSLTSLGSSSSSGSSSHVQSSGSGSASSGASLSSGSGYNYEPPKQIENTYLPPQQYIAPAPQAVYGPPPAQLIAPNGGYQYERPTGTSSSGSASSSSSLSESSSGSSSGLGGLGGLVGGFGNIFKTIGQIPSKAVGVKRGAVNSIFDAKIKILEQIAQLAGGGSQSQVSDFSH